MYPKIKAIKQNRSLINYQICLDILIITSDVVQKPLVQSSVMIDIQVKDVMFMWPCLTKKITSFDTHTHDTESSLCRENYQIIVDLVTHRL